MAENLTTKEAASSAGVTSKDWYQQLFVQRQATQFGRTLPWLQQLRAQNMTDFMQVGFPTQRDEAWKYTDISLLSGTHHAVLAEAVPLPQYTEEVRRQIATIIEPFQSDHHLMVFADGYYQAELSTQLTLPDACIVSSLTQAARCCPQILVDSFTQLNSERSAGHDHAFTQLNAAFATDGLFCRIIANKVVDKPLHMIHVATRSRNIGANAQQHQPTMFPLWHVLDIGEHSQVDIIEEYISLTLLSAFPNQHFTVEDGA